VGSQTSSAQILAVCRCRSHWNGFKQANQLTQSATSGRKRGGKYGRTLTLAEYQRKPIRRRRAPRHPFACRAQLRVSSPPSSGNTSDSSRQFATMGTASSVLDIPSFSSHPPIGTSAEAAHLCNTPVRQQVNNLAEIRQRRFNHGRPTHRQTSGVQYAEWSQPGYRTCDQSHGRPAADCLSGRTSRRDHSSCWQSRGRS
jgi:hypothetical protein